VAPADVLPLADLRVVDLTIARAGPTCVRQLADWGADVVRVEPLGAGAGDSGRHGSDFQNLHRNKRAIAIDLKQPDGLELLLRLADGADVLVENMRPAVKSRLGFDYEAVHRRNPRLVYASLSGFGQDGPYADRGGVDQIAQGMGGLMSVTGLPGTEPTRVGIPVADLSAGLYLAIGVLVALHERERTGIGRWVQTSLLEAMIAMMDLQATRWTMDGVVAAQEGNHHPTQVPMGCFRSADGFVNIAGAFGRLLRRFCEAIGLPDLPTDARFDTTAKRSANRAELNRLIGDQLLLRTTGEWVEVLNAVGVPCGPVLSTDEVFADPQVTHLGMAATVTSPVLGDVAILRNAVSMTDGPPTVRTATPEAGEHTTSVLFELGLGSDEIEDLRRRKVVS
jgi:formyl-CoA transferase